MNHWTSDKSWSDRFIPSVCSIMGRVILAPASIEEDRKCATDLVILRAKEVRIAVRIRRLSYLTEYADEFTIRSDRPSGNETEFAKIIGGFGDYLFYGFGGDDGMLMDWFVGDLLTFRMYVLSYLVSSQGRFPGIEKVNGDQTSFRVFKRAEVKPYRGTPFVVASRAAEIAAAKMTLGVSA